MKALSKVDIREDGTIYRLDGSLAAQYPRSKRQAHLSVSIEGKPYLVHRLVATKYIPNPGNLPQVNHKDEDPTNNCVDNLEWCTHKYNITYSKGKPITLSKKGEVLSFDSQREAARQLGINKGNLSQVCTGKRATVSGWRLVS